jgi:hypothetical protein
MNYLVLITLNKITEKGLCEGKNKNAKKLWVSTFRFRVVILDHYHFLNYCTYIQYYAGRPRPPTTTDPSSVGGVQP